MINLKFGMENLKVETMGVIIALFVILLWGGHLFWMLLNVPVDPGNFWFWVHLLFQAYLFTGLFITAHDAMHGTVSRNRKVNNVLGFAATLLYAGMWYPMLQKNHYKHHLYPATGDDPDYHTGSQNFFVWWFSFMKHYITWYQLVIMAVLFNAGLLFFTELQLIVLWIVPSILSTFQLFYFGTFRVHRRPHTPEMEPHKSRTQGRNHLWAMLSCYFFGYHYEHHASPRTPWWQLYRMKENRV